jgi:ribosomal protein S18 acetylase RimI-like enzyme
MTSTFDGTVRQLRAADLIPVERILSLWVRESPSSPPLATEIDGYLALMSSSLAENTGYRYLVATAEEFVVGVVGMRPPCREMHPFVMTDRPVEMINAYVETRLRQGRGVGTALVRELERLARACGYREMVLNSGPRYRGSGWKFFDRLKDYERRGAVMDLYGPGGHAPVWGKLL